MKLSISVACYSSNSCSVLVAISETIKWMRPNVFSITEKTCPKLVPKPIDIFAHTTSSLTHCGAVLRSECLAARRIDQINSARTKFAQTALCVKSLTYSQGAVDQGLCRDI
jgi:hypothetical protein